MDEWPQVLEKAREVLEKKYGISHITLQPEPVEEMKKRFMCIGE